MQGILRSPHRSSYARFLEEGLERLLRPLFPRGGAGVELHYVGMRLGAPILSEQACLDLEQTYRGPVWLTLRLAESDEVQPFLLGEVPLLTERDTLVVKGKERTPIGQLLLAPGVYFERTERTVYDASNERRDHIPTWEATIRPLRGASLRISITGEGDTANGWVRVGLRKAEPLRVCLAELQLLDRARQVLGSNQFFQWLVQDDVIETLEAKEHLRTHFFTPNNAYDLSDHGRQRLHARLGECARQCGLSLGSEHYLTGDDVIAMLAYLLGLKQEESQAKGFITDDLNHLKNRRLVLLGEQMETALREAISGPLHGRKTIQQLIDDGLQGQSNVEYIFSRIRGAFHRAIEQCLHPRRQLCQMLDQTNPLAEVSHTRKVTFCGPGGVQSKYGGLTRRGIHSSHYGRLCLLETPESDHIGLNLHLATYAQVHDDGQIAAPYRAVPDGAECYLTPEAEETYILASSSLTLDAESRILTRQGLEDVATVASTEVTHTDLVAGQCLGLAASLIPFVQHDELNRAMMGSKNMKQAVPLLHPEPPRIKTGMEATVARLSGRLVLAQRAGTVSEVSTAQIVVACPDDSHDIYTLRDYSPTSSSTCLYQKPAVQPGAEVIPGQVLADAAATRDGQLALGVNLLVAYMPWYGYNFEDGIVISDRLVRAGVLTSRHVREFRSAIYGNERVGVGQLGLDERRARSLHGHGHSLDGIIRKDTHVSPGIVLFTKWDVYKGVDQAGPFYQYTPAWMRGTVVKSARIAVGEEKIIANRPRSDPEDPALPKEVIKIWTLSERPIAVGDKLMGRHGNKGIVGKIVPEAEMPRLEDGTPIDVILNPHGVVSRLNLGQLYETHLGWVAKVLDCSFVAPPFQRVRLESGANQHIQAQVERILADSATDRQALERLLELANAHSAVQLEHGKATLVDSATGRAFANPVTVGYQYLMKLNHLVADKIQAREEGEYVNWVEQPVQGRKEGGGQRLGEMEVWALEAHNTPELLREFLTYKSDDVITRQDVWAQVGTGWLPSYLPESFRVTAFLLRGLGLKLELFKNGAQEPEELTYKADIDQRNIERLRISIATADDIRHWGPREVRATQWRKPRKTVVWACACPGQKGLHGEKHQGEICSRCRKRVEAHVIEQDVFTEDGLFSEPIFGAVTEQSDRRHTMAHLPLHTPVFHPLFIGQLSRLVKGLRPFVEFERVWLPETDKELSWEEYKRQCQECEEHHLSPPQALSGADYLLYRLELLETPPQGWDPREAILTLLPILPPALRPLFIQNGQERALGLNLLYRRVLVANAQLGLLSQDPAATVFKVHEKKQRLQRAVHALFISGYTDKRQHHYRSLGELLQGKEGILRQHLLGKRTNYSGRSVIVPGPELELDECGLPVAMAAAMCKSPIAELLGKESSLHKRIATVWPEHSQRAALETLMANRLVLLNRAPTLHRYNLLAFRPRLHQEQTIALHPLVCGGFNADFDGDTMAVHLPLLGNSSGEALGCLPSRHLLSIANGRLLLHFTQDMVAGIYWQTMTETGRRSFTQLFDAPDIVALDPHETNKPVGKDALLDYLTRYLCAYGEEQTAQKANALMRWGFTAATEAGLTLGLWDVPWIAQNERRDILRQLLQNQALSWGAFEQLQQQGGKPYEDIMQAWKAQVEKAIGERLAADLARNPLAVIITSGARGKLDDACQLGGLRGLMDKLGGRPFREPVDANFVEGLSPVQYFISAFASRKTMVDKKLKTADAGDLTRRLVEAAYPLLISQEGECNSAAGITLREIVPLAGGKGAPLAQRLLGRVLANDVYDGNGHRVATRGEMVASLDRAVTISTAAINGVTVRSPLTCQADIGVCQHCYGWDLSKRHLRPETRRFPDLGLPVGIIAGQSIGERGTQLTMRTFHSGGVRGEDITQGLPQVKRLAEGWLDLRLYTITEPGDTGLTSGQMVDAWELSQLLQGVEGKCPPAYDEERDLKTVRLGDVLKRTGLDALGQLFLWRLHQIYGSDVDSRHFEIILCAMVQRQQDTWRLRGVSQAALDREGFLAAASFQRTLEVLTQAAVERREDWIKGYKERLMVGKAIR